MAEFSSKSVEMFPSTYRSVMPRGKFTSERNFVNIINALTDNIINNNQSYVLNFKQTGSASTVGTLEVVIAGYYFIITDYNYAGDTWLSIKVEKGTNCLVNYNNMGIDNLDDASGTGQFHGIQFSSTKPENESNADYITTHLQVSRDSKLINKYRFKTDSIAYEETDGSITDLTTKLNEKQAIVKPVAPLSFASDDVTLHFDDSDFIQYSEQKQIEHNPAALLYVTESGALAKSGKSLGQRDVTSDVYKFQNVYLNKGEFTGGQTIYASTRSPNTEEGSEGDFWFKYN